MYFNVFVSPRDEDVSLVIQGLGGKANQEKEPIQKHTNTNTNTKNRDKGGRRSGFQEKEPIYGVADIFLIQMKPNKYFELLPYNFDAGNRRQ